MIVSAEKRAPGLRPGSSVGVRFAAPGSREQTLFELPRDVLNEGLPVEGSRGSIWVADAGRAERRDIQVVEVNGRNMTVRGELVEGELVILDADAELEPGDAVVPQADGRASR